MPLERSYEAPQMVQQQQQFNQDPQMFRQFIEQPTQSFEYAYTGDMVAAENPNTQMENDQGRFFKKVSHFEVALGLYILDIYFIGKGLRIPQQRIW